MALGSIQFIQHIVCLLKFVRNEYQEYFLGEKAAGA